MSPHPRGLQVLFGLLWRQALFWVGWGLQFIVLAKLVSGNGDSLDALCRVGRISLFTTTFLMLALEWAGLDGQIKRSGARLRKLGAEPPSRLELVFFSWGAIFLQCCAWVVLLDLRSVWATGSGERSVVTLSLAWAWASALALALLGGVVTTWRYRRAEHRADRALAAAHRPTAFPFTTALWCMGALCVAFVRLPHLGYFAGNRSTAVAQDGPSVVGVAPPPVRLVELLVELGPDDHPSEIDATVRGYGGTITSRAVPNVAPQEDVDLAATWVVRVPMRSAEALWLALRADRENVDRIELNHAVGPSPMSPAGPCPPGSRASPTNDPLVAGQEPLRGIGGFEVLRALQLPRTGVVPSRVAVAIIDTGIDASHEDLAPVTVSRGGMRDSRGHGTAVAGIAGAVADNGRGMASLNHHGRYVELRSYPALDEPNAAAEDVADAIFEATRGGAKVIVMSFGANGQAPHVVRRAVEYAWRRDVILVAAAGNGGQSGADASDQWPANVPGVLVVGATEGVARAPYSSKTLGVGLSVSAPGTDVCAPAPGGGYALHTGTSMAAPLVGGMIGVYRSLCPAASATDALGALLRAAQAGPPGLGPSVRADALFFEGACPVAATPRFQGSADRFERATPRVETADWDFEREPVRSYDTGW